MSSCATAQAFLLPFHLPPEAMTQCLLQKSFRHSDVQTLLEDAKASLFAKLQQVGKQHHYALATGQRLRPATRHPFPSPYLWRSESLLVQVLERDAQATASMLCNILGHEDRGHVHLPALTQPADNAALHHPTHKVHIGNGSSPSVTESPFKFQLCKPFARQKCSTCGP